MKKRSKNPHTSSDQTPRVLVTGASGFVGSAIVAMCRSSGFQVFTAGRSDNSPGLDSGYHKADITDFESLTEAMAGIDFVVHAAGLAHQFKKNIKASVFNKTNTKGTENVAIAAVRAGVKHLVHISSVSVYGPHGKEVCDEDTPCHPLGAYAESKYQAEKWATEILQSSGVRLTILRLATVYGEGDPGNVARLMRMIDRGRFVWVGDGSNRKSLIHRDDVALACVRVLQHASSGINTYNVSASVNTMREIAEGLASALGRDLPRWRIPRGLARTMARSFDRISVSRKSSDKFRRTLDKWLEDDIFDASRFNAHFDFQPSVPLSEGLKREVSSYRHRQSIS